MPSPCMGSNAMNEVIPGLWIGDLSSALDTDQLREHNIRSVLSAMRGRVRINETFTKLQINLDDTDDADVLSHLVAAIQFIEAELEKGRGVLVHCVAGLSRSATIVAAYLMYVQHVDYEAALELIRKVRPNVQPNDGFLRQLAVFQEASFRVSRHDKATRMYYLERVVEEVMNGDGSIETDFFAKFPRTPSDSAPATPGGPRRRIRCKMCRQELAAREHMLDHGQVGPATPAFASPAPSRRPSSSVHDGPVRPFASLTPLSTAKSPPSSRRPSTHDTHPSISSPFSPSSSRRPSMNEVARPTGLAPLTPITPISPSAVPMARRASGSGHEPITRSRLGSNADTRPLKSSLLALQGAAQLGQDISDELSESALEGSDEEEEEEVQGPPNTALPPANRGTGECVPDSPSTATSSTAVSDTASRDLNVKSLSLTNSMPSPPTSPTADGASSAAEPLPAIPPALVRRVSSTSSSPLAHGSDLAAQLLNHPKLAALRSPPSGLNMSAMTSPSPGASGPGPVSRSGSAFSISPPLLANTACSGYFVEPMKWMDSFLQDGQMAGKIVCPNKKCGAKLGNYDWAGVCCSCKQWVVPGFCIHRSKVDEVVV